MCGHPAGVQAEHEREQQTEEDAEEMETIGDRERAHTCPRPAGDTRLLLLYMSKPALRGQLS